MTKGQQKRKPRARTIKKMVKTAVTKMTEPKYFDIKASAAQIVDNVGGTLWLNKIDRGTDSVHRIGRKYTVRGIQLFCNNYVDQTSGINQAHRVMVIWDKHPQGTLPVATDFLKDSLVESPKNINNRKRFITLFDRIINLNKFDEAGSTRSWDHYIKCNVPVLCNDASTSDITDYEAGAIYLFVIGTVSVVAPALAGSIYWNCRIKFLDM